MIGIGRRSFTVRTLEWQVVWSDDEIGWEEYGVEGQAHVAINRWDREEPLPAKSAIVGVLSVEDAYATTEALKAKGVRCAGVPHPGGGDVWDFL